MKLIVGLGNPGEKYSRHRHNAGFMILDEIAERHGLGPWRKRFQGEIAEGILGDTKVLLLKPMTYMNESGRSVGEAERYYKIPIEDITVIHDEVDLKPGKIRVKTGGGNAGHNGLKSVCAHVGADFKRVRIGVGHPGQKDKVPGYVLHDFSKADFLWFDPLMHAIAECSPQMASGDDVKFMNDVARRCQVDEAERLGKDEEDTSVPETSQPARKNISGGVAEPHKKEEGPLASALKKWFQTNND